MHASLLLTVLPLLLLHRDGTTTEAVSNITFLHINDHHSHFEELPFDIQDANFLPPDLSVYTTRVRFWYGGFGRAASVMKLRESEATNTVKIHAGDALSGTVFYTFFGPSMDASAMNTIGFDAFVLGNHEFDQGDSNLASFLEELDAQTVSFNVNPAETLALRSLPEEKLVKPWTIKEFDDGDMLGICGITIKVTTEQSSFPDPGTTIADEQESSETCVSELTAAGVDKIVLVTHIGYSRDLEWLTTIDGVDVIVGGHSHSLLGGEQFTRLGFPVRDDYPRLEGRVCVATSWEYVRVVGSFTVEFDDRGEVTSCSGRVTAPLNPTRYTVLDADPRFNLDASDADKMTNFLVGLEKSPFVVVEEDPDIVVALAPFFESADERRNEVIATVPKSICHTYTEQDAICPKNVLSNFLGGGVCNLVATGFLSSVPNADFAIQNRGGCRTDIIEGEFTFGDVFNILPFANTLVTFEMTGPEIKSILEDAVNFLLSPNSGGGGGSYPFASGLRYALDYTQPFGERVSDLEFSSRFETNWAPLDLTDTTTTFTVATNSFIASGRDGYFTFNAIDDGLEVDTFVEYGQSFVDFVKEQEVLKDLPLSKYSTQSITTYHGITYAVEDEPSSKGHWHSLELSCLVMLAAAVSLSL